MPYSLHVLNAVVYVIGALILHRLVRRSFGSLPAMLGLTVLLLLPSLFAWSISALKESMYVFLTAVEIVRRFDLGRLVSATYPLDDYKDAISHAASAGRRGAVKIAFDMRES